MYSIGKNGKNVYSVAIISFRSKFFLTEIRIPNKNLFNPSVNKNQSGRAFWDGDRV